MQASEFVKTYRHFTTPVGHKTLDECPMAYNDMTYIVNNIGTTADIIKIIKLSYDFKAGEYVIL